MCGGGGGGVLVKKTSDWSIIGNMTYFVAQFLEIFGP